MLSCPILPVAQVKMPAKTPKMSGKRAESGDFGRILTEYRTFGRVCVLTDWYAFSGVSVQIEFFEKTEEV